MKSIKKILCLIIIFLIILNSVVMSVSSNYNKSDILKDQNCDCLNNGQVNSSFNLGVILPEEDDVEYYEDFYLDPTFGEEHTGTYQDDPDGPILLNEYPANNQEEVMRSPYFYVEADDPQDDVVSLTFRTNANGEWEDIYYCDGPRSDYDGKKIYCCSPPDVHGESEWWWSFMNDFDTQYYWSVNATDGAHWTNQTFTFRTHPEVPSEWDWRDVNGKDYTTPVRNQGNCGSCYAFSVTSLMESAIKIYQDDPDLDIDLSEQYIVSCWPGEEGWDGKQTGGCKGGDPVKVLEWLSDTGGIIPEECFHYTSWTGDVVSCDQKCSDYEDKKIPIFEFEEKHYGWRLELGRYNLMKYGPVQATMNVYNDFYNYDGGVYRRNTPDGFGLHAVTILGFKETPGQPYDGYFICKNSWGPDWGENGYFNVAYYNDPTYVEMHGYKIKTEVHFDNMYHITDIGDIPTFMVDGQNDIYRDNRYENTQKSIPLNCEIGFYGVATGGKKPYSYKWDFGDGTTSNQKDPVHIYSEYGYYYVTLTVTDSNGVVKTDVDEILLNTEPEFLSIDCPEGGKINDEISLEVVGKDPNNDQIKYEVKWFNDDGHEIDSCDFVDSETKKVFNYTWSESGKKYVYVKVIDEYGLTVKSNLITIQISKSRSKFIDFFMNLFDNQGFFYKILNFFFSGLKNFE